MKIIIDGEECSYTPNYSISNSQWRIQADDAFAFPVKIGGKLFFIKRFEKSPTGWEILKRLKGKNYEYFPRVVDLVETTEKDKQVFYAFYEYLEGDTLDKILNQNETTINFKNLFSDLAKALYDTTQNKAWVSDFCERNIYFSYKFNHFVLIDLDSTWDTDQRPNYIKNQPGGIISHELMSPILMYFKDYSGNTSFDISQLRGDQVNWLQLIFFTLKLKYYEVKNKFDPTYTYTRPRNAQEATDNLALLLHRFANDYGLAENCQKLFAKAKNSQLSYQDIVDFGSKIFDLQPQILRLEPVKARIRIGETTTFNFLTQGQSQVKIDPTPRPEDIHFESFDVMPQESTAYKVTIKDVFGQEATAVKQVQVRTKGVLAPMLSSIRSWGVAALIVISGVGVYWSYDNGKGTGGEVEIGTVPATERIPRPLEPNPTPKPHKDISTVTVPRPASTLSAEEQFTEYYTQAINKYREGKTPEAIELLEKALSIKSDHRADTLLKELKSYDNE